MTDKPIPFTRAMALATWRGDKTETRRVLRPQPPEWATFCQELSGWFTNPGWKPSGLWQWCEPETNPPRPLRRWPVHETGPMAGTDYGLRLPYAVGDRLWVREPYWQRGYWAPSSFETTEGGATKWRFVPLDLPATGAPVFDPPPSFRLGMRRDGTAGRVDWYQRLARFMPRAYSRQTLLVRAVRVERLHAIDEAGALREGVKPNHYQGAWPFVVETDWFGAVAVGETARDAYRDLWNAINGPGSWDANPWVVVVSYEKLGDDK